MKAPKPSVDEASSSRGIAGSRRALSVDSGRKDFREVGASSVVKMVPGGNNRLTTVDWRSIPASAPRLLNALTRISASPWETTDGGLPGSLCDPRNLLVIGWFLKYCIITLLRFLSDIAALKARSIF